MNSSGPVYAMRVATLLAALLVVGCAPRTPPAAEPVAAADRSVAGARRFLGLYRYFADAAAIDVCDGGKRYPILIEGEHLALERAWLAASPGPEATRLAEFEAVVELRAPEPGLPQREFLRVTRFISLSDASTCPAPPAAPAVSSTGLLDADWQVARLDGQALASGAVVQPPTLRLDSAERRIAGFSGCNRYSAQFESDGAALRFGAIAMTRMACLRDATDVETRFMNLLAAIRSARVSGERLELLDDAGVARIEAEKTQD